MRDRLDEAVVFPSGIRAYLKHSFHVGFTSRKSGGDAKAGISPASLSSALSSF